VTLVQSTVGLVWFSSDICSSPNSWSPRSLALCRLPKVGIHGYVTVAKMLVLICLYYSKCTTF